MRKFDINGSAPSRSKIKLIGPEGRMIGDTEANSAGNWKIFGVTFTPGDHTCYAQVRTPAGSLMYSDDLDIHVETPEELAAQAEERERAMALYENVAEQFAAGADIDPHTVKEVCDLAGQSIEQFIDDVTLIRDLAEQDAMIAARMSGSPCWSA